MKKTKHKLNKIKFLKLSTFLENQDTKFRKDF